MSETARRLAAIMAVDVAGYSRLMGEDEAGTARSVREHREAARPIVAAHGGRVVKTMGDGVLLEFPSVVAAVECAIAVQRLMIERNQNMPDERRIIYRIGINLGDVLIEGEDILGDGVNIAARLEGIAEPGGICLSGSAYDQVRGKVAAAFVDLGEKELKNIARPVRVYAIAPQNNFPAPAKAGAHRADAATGSSMDPDFRRGGEKLDRVEKEGPPRLSIVVLPFANIGGDPEQEYFVDGVTESLTTDLSRISGSFVIARNTAFTYKGRPFDVKQIGRELNVRYVLEGSVQKGGNRLRVNVQLIDAETGNHLWAERFDKPVADLFDMQDEIVTRLASQLNTELVAAEARRAERAPHPDSMDLYFQGMAWLNKGTSPTNLAQARDFFQRSRALDPSNLEALVGTAFADASRLAYMTDDRDAIVASVEANLKAVLAVAPNHVLAHVTLGFIKVHSNRAAEGIVELEQALALDPNLAIAYGTIGQAKWALGRAEETEAHIQEALRLSPRDWMAYLWVGFIGCAKFRLGKYEEAVEWLRRSTDMNRNFPLMHFYLAASLAYLGRLDEARAAAQNGLALDPGFTIRRFRAGGSSDNPVYLAQNERIVDGMRKAGVPEG